MSWHCSQALVAAFSEATCSDGAPSAPSSTTPTPAAYYWPDKTTEHSRLSRFGMTSEPLTADHGAELLTWFLAASHARTSPLPEMATDSMASAPAFGQRWLGSLAKYNPHSRTWKTHQCSLLGGSDEFSETWPQWGSMRNGELWLRPIPALLTSVSESGYWPTPTVCGNYNRKGASATSGDGLATAVKKGKSRMERTGSKAVEVLPQAVGGPLSPDWTEWLMGWPIGWTDLKPLETVRFHEWQQQHSIS